MHSTFPCHQIRIALNVARLPCPSRVALRRHKEPWKINSSGFYCRYKGRLQSLRPSPSRGPSGLVRQSVAAAAAATDAIILRRRRRRAESVQRISCAGYFDEVAFIGSPSHLRKMLRVTASPCRPNSPIRQAT